MSALESPPSLTPIWQDPWTSAVTGAVVAGTEDFYGHNLQNKVNVSPMVNQAAFYHHHHLNHHQTPMVPQGYHHPALGPMEAGQQNNNNNSMNSDANSSSTTSSTNSSNAGQAGKNTNSNTGAPKPHRQVNFKLDIKSEPELIGPDFNQPGGVQKVPSISDLSDPESSLDIPCSQVSFGFSFCSVKIFKNIWLF